MADSVPADEARWGQPSMTIVGVIASLAIGAMFIVSGALKLSDRDAWRRQSADLGVDGRVARVVPLYEIVLGAALISGIARPWPAVLAVATLAVFTWFLARRMLDGTRPPCACFGSHSTRPLGRRHLLRNGALLVIAALGVLAS